MVHPMRRTGSGRSDDVGIQWSSLELEARSDSTNKYHGFCGVKKRRAAAGAVNCGRPCFKNEAEPALERACRAGGIDSGGFCIGRQIIPRELSTKRSDSLGQTQTGCQIRPTILFYDFSSHLM